MGGYNGDVAYQNILYDVADPVAIITLNRPAQLNAITAAMTNELADAIGRAEADPAVVGIVLTGAGKGFCAGADMNMLRSLAAGDEAAPGGPGATGYPSGRAQESVTDTGGILGASNRPGDPDAGDDLRGTHTYLLSLRKPMIAAINGAVAGMAVPLALACDLRFMSTDAVITTSFAQRGLIAEWGVAWQLSRLVGPAVALDLLFSSRKVRGDEAERLGLVNRSVPPGEVVDVARHYIEELSANCSPSSIAVMKRQVYLDLHRGLGVAQGAAERLMRQSFERPDFAEGVRSFLDRRNPIFARLGETTSGPALDAT